MTQYFDAAETRTNDARDADLARALPAALARARCAPGMAAHLASFGEVVDRAGLAALPVLRKSDLGAAQKAEPPFGGLTPAPAHSFGYVFQSPGPIYEPGGSGAWTGWRDGAVRCMPAASGRATSCTIVSPII